MFSNEMFQSAVESAHCPIVITDAQKPDNPISYVNPTFTLQTGYTLDEAVGQNCRFLQGADTNQAELDKVRNALREGTSTIALLSNYRKDGTQFWNELHISPILNDKGIVTHFVGVQNDISDRVRLEGELRQLAATDPLTGALNRRHFFEACEREFDRAKRYHHRTVLLMVDIDCFKNINDTYGHLAGDEALMCFATTCRDILRSQDTLGRIGGDEFAILIPETDKAGGYRVAERLRARTSSLSISNEKYAFQFTISIGGTMCAPAYDDVQTSLDHADQALYEAKLASRNQVAWSKEAHQINDKRPFSVAAL